MGKRCRRSTWGDAAWLAGYVLVAGVTIALLIRGRKEVLHELATPHARAAWNAWREAARREDGTTGPVRRSVPRSEEPPALVLLRDYFATVLVGALVIETTLYFVLMLLARGAVRSVRQIPRERR